MAAKSKEIVIPPDPEPEAEPDSEPEAPKDLPFPLVLPNEAEGRLKILIHGDPGVGKTWLVGTAVDCEDMVPILLVDTEGGTLTIRDKMKKGVLDVVRVNTYSEMVKLITYLRRGDHPYRTIAVDSLTEMQKAIMADIMRTGTVRNPEKDPDIPEMRDWGKNAERVRKVVRAFRDLPNVHVIFTTLSRDIKDDRTGVTTTKPSLPGQLQNEIPGYIDIVGWLHVVTKEVKEGDKRKKVLERHIMFQPARNVLVKDRSDTLGVVVEEPTMKSLMETVLSKKED